MRRFFGLLLFLSFVALSAQAFSQNFDLQHDRMPLAELRGQFRFHAGDDPRYADPSFDDSGWSLLKSDQSWYDQGYKNYSGFGWYRFRVIVPVDYKNTALFVPYAYDSYAVYANGRLIGQLGDFPPAAHVENGHNLVYVLPSSAVAADHTIVFAVRVWRAPLLAPSSGAGIGASPVFGDAAAVEHWSELQIHDLFWSVAGIQLHAIVNVVAMILGFALFLVRPCEREYLWYGVAQVFWSTQSACNLALYFLKVPVLPTEFAFQASMFVGFFIDLIFFYVLLRQRRGVLFWIGGVPVLVPIAYLGMVLAGWARIQNLDQVIAFCYVPYTVAVCLLIYRAARRGSKEAWILLVPFSASAVMSLWFQAEHGLGLDRFPAVAAFRHLLDNIVTWPIRLDEFAIIGISCNLAICAVLILRFASSRRDEERLSAELEAARAVQQILVPEEVPSIAGFSVEAVYHPAGEVGGDFYQVLPTPNGSLLAVIGDVSGKGMPAAMTVSLLVGAVRTLADSTQDPAAILTAMNRRLIGRGNGFTTALVLRLDPDGTCTAANAGHIAPYANGKELQIENGLPLGVTAAAAYSNSTLQLQADSTLTLLTDGVVEAQNATGELFGFDRSRELSTSSAATIVEAARAFGQQDDITVVALACTRVPASVLAPASA